jgi:hypothetical protein
MKGKWAVKLGKAMRSRIEKDHGQKGRLKRWAEKYVMFVLPFVTVLRWRHVLEPCEFRSNSGYHGLDRWCVSGVHPLQVRDRGMLTYWTRGGASAKL